MKLLASAILIGLAVAAAFVPAFIHQDSTSQIQPSAPTAQQAIKRMEAMPVRFEPAAGPESAFLGRGFGYTIFLTPGGAAVSPEKDTAQIFRMQLVGSNLHAAGGGAGQPAGVSNYLLGNRRAWRTNVQNFTAVRYSSVYPGVDLLYYGKQRELEYDFIVAPRARHDVIALRFDGVDTMDITSAGDLRLRIGRREAALRKPIAYQESNGTRAEVACNFVMRENGEVGFEVGAYDASLPLVIDPILSYSTFLGGGGDDPAASVALDGSGNIYVTGRTTSSAATFPETGGAAQVTLGGNQDVYVAKISSSGPLVYATYIGGNADDRGFGIDVDGSGNAHVTGTTFSNNFPTAGSSSSLSGNSDGFVVKLNSSGSALTFSAYLGGNTDDAGQAIRVNSSGDIFIVGATNSSNFPTSNALQSSFRGVIDGFIVKLNSSGATQFSTFFGGNGDDRIFDGALDSSSNLYITGRTTSNSNFHTSNAFQSTFGGGSEDAFVAKLSSGGNLMYSTYLGGSGSDAGDGIAVDGAGSAYVTGFSSSTNFPLQSAVQSNNAGGADAFLTKMSPNGGSLVYSTLLGGSATDQGVSVGVDGSGRAVVVGSTSSNNFNTSNAFQSSLGGGGFDAFVAMFTSNGSSLVYSTYLGGGGNDEGFGARVNSGGTVFLAGETSSGNFATIGAFQTSLGGQVDGFVASVEPTGGGAAPFQISVTPNTMTVARGSAASYNVNVTSVGGAFNGQVNLGCMNLPTGTRCTFSPTSVTPGGSGATATLSISTTAPAAIPPVRPLGPQTPMPLLWMLVALFALSLLAARAQRRQLRWRLLPTAALLFVIALALGAQISCGGGGGSNGGNSGGQGVTAPGTYTVGVMGTSGGMQASTNVTLVVQ